MGIGEVEVQTVGKQVMALMRDYLTDIKGGYDETEKDFSISFKSIFNQAKQDPDAMEIKTEISFLPMVKIKDSAKNIVGGKQSTILDDNESVLVPFRLTPRYLIDMTKRPHCQAGYGPWCTLRFPCWSCEGRDHADSLTFNERRTRELEDEKLRKASKPIPRKENTGRMRGLRSA